MVIGIKEKPFNYNTLEPSLFRSNDLDLLNKILETDYINVDDLHKYMKANKTECALKIFSSDIKITYPEYILRAIK